MRKTLSLSILALGIFNAGCAPQVIPVRPCYYNNEFVDRQYVHRYGLTMPQHVWELSDQNGQVVTTTKDGVTCSQSYYAGVLEGDTSYTFPYSSSLEKVELYSQNQLLKETLYYHSGARRQETTFAPQENATFVKQWYENGGIKSDEKFSGKLLVHGNYYDPQGKSLSGIDEGRGLRMVRNPYGLLEYTEAFKDGEVQYQTTYYSDGTPKEIDPYMGGVVHGIRKTYYPGGEPKTIETWKEGKQQGLTTIFKDGEKVQEIPYVDGYKNGVGRVYKDGKFIVQKISWKDDLMHGPCHTYIDNRVCTDWYIRGKKVTKGYYDSFHVKPTGDIYEPVTP